MKLGVVGLPNVGKSTLFNAITQAGAEAANYPFCTIEPNVGVVAVPDKRLDELGKLYNTQKITPAIIEFVDIAGIVKGASKGEGLGNKFLSHIREVDAIVHVVRCFENSNIIHVENSVDPKRDIETINLELIFADMESVDKRIAKAEKSAKGGDKTCLAEMELLTKCQHWLTNEKPLRTMTVSDEEKEMLKSFFLLTTKPVIYVANISDDEIKNAESLKNVKTVEEFAKQENAEVIVLCAKIEEELTKLQGDDRELFYEELGITESGLDKLVTSSYRLLNLISYLTAGEKEVRAWTITKGDKAPKAAGKIHTDFEKGFIKAEVCDWKNLVECGGYVKAKECGKMRMEGKDYEVQDGDVILFRFNV